MTARNGSFRGSNAKYFISFYHIYKVLAKTLRPLIGDEKGWSKRWNAFAWNLDPQMNLEEDDHPIKGSEFIIDVDTVITAIGETPLIIEDD